MLERGAATTTDDVHPEILDELGQCFGQPEWLERVQRLPPAKIDRNSSVGDHADRRACALEQIADGLAHVLGTCRAIEPDDVYAQTFENSQRRGDVGAQQHAAVGVQRDLGLQRQGSPAGGETPSGAENGRFGLENVLLRLDDQQVSAAILQTASLLGEDLDQRLEADVRQGGVVGGRQKPGGADGAGYEAGSAVLAFPGVALAPRNGSTGEIDRVGLVGQPPFFEPQSTGLERVAFDDVAASRQEAPMQSTGGIRAADAQRVHAAFVALAAEIVRTQLQALQIRAHRSIEDEHAPLQFGQIISLRHSRESFGVDPSNWCTKRAIRSDGPTLGIQGAR
jgi:hypothetical protein